MLTEQENAANAQALQVAIADASSKRRFDRALDEFLRGCRSLVGQWGEQMEHDVSDDHRQTLAQVLAMAKQTRCMAEQLADEVEAWDRLKGGRNA